MQRSKLLVLAVATAVGLGGAMLLLGNASAATWYDYEGDLHAGHAYGLQVPTKADAYEIILDGDATATAQIALYDPAGQKLGYHTLDASDPSVLIESPAKGRHAIYVYEIEGGALKLRVDAPLAPVTTSLQEMPLYKEELALDAPSSPGPLDLDDEVTLRGTPVFLTLLYEGSAKNLDASVASPAGEVVSIVDESGTAFSPGVWSSLSGERRSEPANIDGVSYQILATAERFEGSLVLTTLTIDQAVPEVTAPVVDAPVVNGEIKLPVGVPIAFTATKGEVTLAQVEDVVKRDNDTDQEDYYSAGLSLYAPDDTLLAYVRTDSDDENLTITLPEDGEYVAYLHHASDKAMVLRLMGSASATGVRELTTAQEEFDFDLSPGLGREGAAFEIQHVPLEVRAKLDKASTGVLGWVNIENDNGYVASANAFAKAPGVDLFDWSSQDPANFAAGSHELRTQGVVQGKLRLVSVYYQRVTPAEPIAEEPAEDSVLGL